MNSKIFNLALATLIYGLPSVVLAQVAFRPLVGIPGLDPNASFNNYINALYALAISVAALIAVIKIIIAGVKYMLSDVVSSKGAAREDIQSALLGLLIIAAAYLILNQINPNLTTSKLLLSKVDPSPQTAGNGANNGNAPLGNGGTQTNTSNTSSAVVGTAPGGSRPGALSTPSLTNPDWLPQKEVPTTLLSENPSRAESSTPCTGAACVRAADNCLEAGGRVVPTAETTAIVCSYHRTDQVNCTDNQITVEEIEYPVRNCYGVLLTCQDRTPELQTTLWREGSITCKVPHNL